MTTKDSNLKQVQLYADAYTMATLAERERCLKLVKARIARLGRVKENYEHRHGHALNINAAVENLKCVRDWISDGLSPEDVYSRSPGGDPT